MFGNQSTTTSALLSRVNGIDSSVILGSLQANGSLYRLPPNIVVLRVNTTIGVGSILVSTVNMADDDLWRGAMSSTRTSTASGPRWTWSMFDLPLRFWTRPTLLLRNLRSL